MLHYLHLLPFLHTSELTMVYTPEGFKSDFPESQCSSEVNTKMLYLRRLRFMHRSEIYISHQKVLLTGLMTTFWCHTYASFLQDSSTNNYSRREMTNHLFINRTCVLQICIIIIYQPALPVLVCEWILLVLLCHIFWSLFCFPEGFHVNCTFGFWIIKSLFSLPLPFLITPLSLLNSWMKRRRRRFFIHYLLFLPFGSCYPLQSGTHLDNLHKNQ